MFFMSTPTLELIKDWQYIKDKDSQNICLDAQLPLADTSILSFAVVPPVFDAWMWFHRYDSLEYFETLNNGHEEGAKRELGMYPYVPHPQGFDKHKVDKAIMVGEELKFHIALPDHVRKGQAGFEEDEALRGMAWSVVADILFNPDNDIHAFKLLHPQMRFADKDPENDAPNTNSQFGKDLVVYATVRDNKTPEEWVALMEKISNALVDANIPPRAEMPKGQGRETNPLGDSPFICYRFGKAYERYRLIEKRIDVAAEKAHFKQHRTIATASL